MRLTLRTLLAWLDDTLPPAEVRQIGHQVAESPFAQELVERIHRVARQRRLTVPNSAGSEATDANVVAAYLDNELPPDQVADFEKRCLTSDVHLAEVASVHQILSLIGQKAKVPPEARHRMYRLVKGREAMRTKPRRAYSPPQQEAITEPLVPWAPPEPPQRSWLERYGPAGIVMILIVILCWSTWLSLNPGTPATPPRTAVAVAPTTPAPPPAAKPAGPALGEAGAAAAAADTNKTGGPATGAEAGAAEKGASSDESSRPSTEKGASEEAKKASATPAALPAGAIGRAESSDGVLLRFNTSTRAWERVKADAPLKDGDRLVSLEHYRNKIKLGKVPVVLVGLTEIRPHTPDPGTVAAFELVRGRAVVRDAKLSEPVAVKLAGQLVKLTPSTESPVAVEITEPTSSAPADIKIYSADGDVSLAAGDTKESLSGPAAVTFQAPDQFTQKEKRDPPSWVTETSAPPLDKQIGEQFARSFKADPPVVKSLLEAMEDEQKDVRQMAISSLGALGEVGIGLVVPALSKPDDPVSRRAAIRTLRGILAQGGDSAGQVREELEQTLGKEEADVVLKLLTGYAPKEAREAATYTNLVMLMQNPDPGVRELALDNLQTLTGRDDLGYSADTPEGPGLKSWQDLLRRRELRPQTAPAAK